MANHRLPERPDLEDTADGPADAARRFVEAATGGRPDRAERLLALHPELTSNLHAALVRGDPSTVEAALEADADLVARTGGARSWKPLHCVCHTTLAHSPAGDANGLVACARLLLGNGADPDARFPWLHHGVRRTVLWGATRATRLLPLAEVLLVAGADPNDGVTFPLAASAGDVAALEETVRISADLAP